MLEKYGKQLLRNLNLSFPLLHDPGNRVATSFGLAFSVDPELREIYRKFGIDLVRFNGDESWQLPMPGRIIIDRRGTIRNSDIHPDHTTRPEPEETLALLRHLKES